MPRALCRDEPADYGGSYRVAGNGFDGTGYGCVMPDGLPAPCNVVEFAIRNGLYDRWANPVRIIERDREVPWQGRGWDPNPDFMGADYWAGPSLRSSSELRRNPNWVALGGETSSSGFFIHESAPQAGEQLSQCLRDALRRFFPTIRVQGKDYSPVDDARFKSGIPGWISTLASVTPGAVIPGAITLGLYDIHYDPNSFNLSGGAARL